MDDYTTAKLTALQRREGVLFEVDSLVACFIRLTDSRQARGKVYALATALVLMVFAKLSGEDSVRGMAQWLAEHKTELVNTLHLPKPRVPGRSTLTRLLGQIIAVEQLEHIFSEFLQRLAEPSPNTVLSLDGKTLRGTIDLDHPRGVHLLAAYLPMQGIVLLQMAVERKENEIPAAARLLNCLDLRGKIITGDALLTQRNLCVQIVEGGGDAQRVFKVKENQPQLHDDIRRLFTDMPPQHDFETAKTVECEHGRLDQRTLTVSSLLQGYSEWPHLAQVFQLVRRVTKPHTGEFSQETTYGVTSLARAEITPSQLQQIVRDHWGIENGLHYRRDVTLHEDRSRLRSGHAPQVMAALNNLVLSLLAWMGYQNAALARRHFNAHLDHAFTLLTTSLR